MFIKYWPLLEATIGDQDVLCTKLLPSCRTLSNPMDCVAHQAPLSMGFSKQEYWSGLPCPPPGDLPNPGIKPESLTSPALADRFFSTTATQEASSDFELIGKPFPIWRDDTQGPCPIFFKPSQGPCLLQALKQKRDDGLGWGKKKVIELFSNETKFARWFRIR